MRLTIDKAVYGGYGLARSGGVVLVRGALPGEIVDAAIVTRKRDYAVAETVAVVEPSPHRVSPPCPAYGVCGGCRLQHADYPCQLAMKASALADTLGRIAKVGTGPPPIRPSDPLRYRHRGQFKADASGLGFHAERTHRVIPVRKCPLMVDGINGLIAACRDAAALRGAAGVAIVSDGERTVAQFGAIAYDDRIVGILRESGAAGVAFRDRAWGSPGLVFRLGGFAYGVSPGTFFQANWKVNLELVGRIGNVKAVCCRIERFRPSGRYEAVVVDPPRTGLSERAVGLLGELGARRVLYVSCNPATLARDLSRLSGVYGIAGIEAYDFFPQTHHVETLVVLERLQ